MLDRKLKNDSIIIIIIKRAFEVRNVFINDNEKLIQLLIFHFASKLFHF